MVPYIVLVEMDLLTGNFCVAGTLNTEIDFCCVVPKRGAALTWLKNIERQSNSRSKTEPWCRRSGMDEKALAAAVRWPWHCG